MASPAFGERLLLSLAKADYDELFIVSAEVDRVTAQSRAVTRWWQGRQDDPALGGRLVLPETVAAAYPAEEGRESLCRWNARALVGIIRAGGTCHQQGVARRVRRRSVNQTRRRPTTPRRPHHLRRNLDVTPAADGGHGIGDRPSVVLRSYVVHMLCRTGPDGQERIKYPSQDHILPVGATGLELVHLPTEARVPATGNGTPRPAHPTRASVPLPVKVACDKGTDRGGSLSRGPGDLRHPQSRRTVGQQLDLGEVSPARLADRTRRRGVGCTPDESPTRDLETSSADA